MVPTFDVLQQKNIWSHLAFSGCMGGLNQKRDFDILPGKLGMNVAPWQVSVENSEFTKIVNGYVFDFTKLHGASFTKNYCLNNYVSHQQLAKRQINFWANENDLA